MSNFLNITAGFTPISLDEMDDVLDGKRAGVDLSSLLEEMGDKLGKV